MTIYQNWTVIGRRSSYHNWNIGMLSYLKGHRSVVDKRRMVKLDVLGFFSNAFKGIFHIYDIRGNPSLFLSFDLLSVLVLHR